MRQINRHTIHLTLWATALLLPLLACEKEIDIDLHSVEPRVVIEGIVKQDSLARVKVSRTLDFDDATGYPDLQGVLIHLKDDAGNEETLEQSASGWYVSKQLTGMPGRTYTLSVTYEEDTYIASSFMPPPVAIDSLTMYQMPVMDFPIPMVHFKDPAGEVNQYYRALLFINGEQNPNIREFVISAEFMDGSAIRQFLSTSIPGDEDAVNKGDELTIELQCIDKGAYLFFSSLTQMSGSTNPTTNIQGGALGYFSACTAHRMSIIATWDD